MGRVVVAVVVVMVFVAVVGEHEAWRPEVLG
jgi:hypothetical protein